MSKQTHISFLPFTSSINPSFWHKFTQLKLDDYKESDQAVPIHGSISNLITIPSKVFFEVDSTSFNREYSCNLGYIPYHGTLYNENTIESFKNKDKNDLLHCYGKLLCEDIRSGKVLEDPSLLNAFVLISFADLKKYLYYYWFAFLSPNNLDMTVNKVTPIVEAYSTEQLEVVYRNYCQISVKNRAFFGLKKGDAEIISCKEATNISNIGSDYYFCFSDGSGIEENPSWILKNYILFIHETWAELRGTNIDVIALRLNKKQSLIKIDNSIIYNTVLPDKIDMDSWIGWERTDQGKLGPRMVNLKSSIDPKSLIESSADLNLKLMKWRMLRDIDLDKIKDTKCLLLGAGTLGCSVGSCLMGWGIRNITFVDNSTVSYSNPARQHLYNFEDCVQNRPKATAAAENMQRILPYIKSKGVQLTIPMPGHVVGESLLQQTKESVEKLVDLINEHDVIFLLTDSRESRWLPALLAVYYDKIIINAALGFDTYLVMRHGGKMVDNQAETTESPSMSGYKTINGNNLGCYFCNDVTAPGNSQKDRTLDQQCTVTRPGVAMIAGALATELMISILQHKHGNNAPAYYKAGRDEGDIFRDNECMLGIVPHSVRGFLSTFSQVLPATQKFKQCICCSDTILNEYRERGFDFILQVLNSSKYLEDLTGITSMMSKEDEVWELSEDDISEG